MKSLRELSIVNGFSDLGCEFYTQVQPKPFDKPRLIHASTNAAHLIDLDPEEFKKSAFLHCFSGQKPFQQHSPLAMVYSGHQFGMYNPQLGDGRGLLLGEVQGPDGRWDVHLKGAGRTPYSRFGDGRAVLRSVIREYLASEALHGLDIPTTRALCIIGSHEPVYRESIETAAMLVRLSRSHIRFGHFEYFHYNKNYAAVKKLADYIIQQHLPGACGTKDRYWQLLCMTVINTAHLIAKWQSVGFAHGVMNTDNMSIIGDTFDYGPFGFLDEYNPHFICNHSDDHGRYAFDQQPGVALWNLNALAHSLSSLLNEEDIKDALSRYEPELNSHYASLVRNKLGLSLELPGDHVLTSELFTLLSESHVDYTIFFRLLCNFSASGKNQALNDLFSHGEKFLAWSQTYAQRLNSENKPDAERQRLMRTSNPKYILRNYLAQQAIEKAEQKQDYTEIDRLIHLLRNPFAEQPDMHHYAAAPPDWSRHLEVSCSS